MKKRIALIAAGALILLGGQTLVTGADAPSCKDLVINSCTGCHGKERACANLGKSKKSWESLIKFMIANGANLSDEEVALLSDCMSEPAAEAVAACADVVPGDEPKK